MKYRLIKILGLIICSTPLLAENEVTFDPSSGIVTMPQVIILGDKDNARFNVKMKVNVNGVFTVAQVDKTSASINTEVEKYITLDTKTGGHLVYGQMLRRNYDHNVVTSPSNSLPYYVTEYVQGAEVRVYSNGNDTAIVAKSLTDRNGFYQKIAAPGNYKICFGATNDYCGTFVTGGAPSQHCNVNDIGGEIKPSVSCTAYEGI